MSELQKLELHDFHLANSAKFTSFGGWEMPVSYGRIIEEHIRTRNKTSLFDVSHMGEIEVSGPDAEAFLDYLLTNSAGAAAQGIGFYSPLCSEQGGTIDDLIAYKRSSKNFLLCVNASNTEKDFDHFLNQGGFDCQIRNLSADFGQLAIQGPSSSKMLFQAADKDFSGLPKMSFTELDLLGGYCLVARTGYTGEDGYEVYCQRENLAALAEAFESKCSPDQVGWAGLAARDSLRLEAGFPLYGHELSEEISPLQAGLGWSVKWQKDDFIGKHSLLEEKGNGLAGKVIFYEVDDRRTPRQNDPVMSSGKVVGRVLSGGYSPLLEKPIGSAWVGRAASDSETTPILSAEVRGKSVGLNPSLPVLKKLKQRR